MTRGFRDGRGRVVPGHLIFNRSGQSSNEQITQADIKASNGVIHVINSVLLPRARWSTGPGRRGTGRVVVHPPRSRHPVSSDTRKG
ncbi:MAG: fasciclin domain-containing protein [Planctomycetaceae bacterium]|nr:fasciclin domain-containing protein [Planctomycetaceae bacterium]